MKKSGGTIAEKGRENEEKEVEVMIALEIKNI